MTLTIILLTTLTLSLLLTGLIKAVAQRISLVDIPNRRSSHTIPTPRGGGLGIFAPFFCGLLYEYYSFDGSTDTFFILLAVGSLLVAAIGFWDDIRPLSIRFRLPVHFGAAALLVLGSRQEFVLNFGYWPSTLSPLLVSLILILAVVWFLNLFNFMDGIDGLAGVEGFFVAGATALLLYLRGGSTAILPALVLSVSCLGFLAWNWPPAKIFMGDVGSGFLGLALAGLALQTSVFSAELPIYCWLILPAVFIADASWTLFRRLIRGDKWYAAHRSHAYQHAAVMYRSHRPVTLAVLVINLLWLLPLAVLCVIFPGFGGVLTLIAYLPLLLLAWRFNAGGHV